MPKVVSISEKLFQTLHYSSKYILFNIGNGKCGHCGIYISAAWYLIFLLISWDLTVLVNNSLSCGEFWIRADGKSEAKYQKKKELFSCEIESSGEDDGAGGTIAGPKGKTYNPLGRCSHHKIYVLRNIAKTRMKQNY